MSVTQSATFDGASAYGIKNRYANAPCAADYTIDQRWETYSPEEHDRWDRLYARMAALVPGRACEQFIHAIDRLELSSSGVPNMARLSDRLEKITGWRVVPVAELVPDDVFFDHLSNKRFPAGAFIRPEHEFDYLEEPDIFHDIFGHVPMLAEPVFADFMEAYGKGGKRALQFGQLHNLARLYWYTVEFGLIKNHDELRIFGAGILSSPHETQFSLEDSSPNRIQFDLDRVMRTNYIIDDFQKSYFVIDTFDSLLETCYQDFAPVYHRLKGQSDLSPTDILETDSILHRGDHKYFDKKKTKMKALHG
ncbi:MAG: phenylalanine 4-monooxygenase [Pseudomonadota bacterium]